MENELIESDNSFIKINIILALLGAVLTIIPTLIFYVICLFGAHGVDAGGHHPEVYLYLLIPGGFYLLWICTIIAAISANIKREINTTKLVLFFFNIVLTIPLLVFYLIIFFKLKFGI